MKKSIMCAIWVGGLLVMGCGGADEDLASDQSTEMSQQVAGESFVTPDVALLADYRSDAKADSVTGQTPVLHIEPDGEWHSINFVNMNYLLGALFDVEEVAILSLLEERQGQGAVIIENVQGPVKITMESQSSPEKTDEDMVRWTLSHRLADGHAMVLDGIYSLPLAQDSLVDVPEEDFLGDDYLEEPEQQRWGFNSVELDAEQISSTLQISMSFYRISDSVRVRIEPLGWHPDDVVEDPEPEPEPEPEDDVVTPVVEDPPPTPDMPPVVEKPKPDYEEDFRKAEEVQKQRAGELLERLRQSNVVLEAAIGKVNAEIRQLETNLYDKQARVEALIKDLDRREDELEEEERERKDNNLLLCALRPVLCKPLLISELKRDDWEYQQIKRDLDAARSDRQVIEAEINSYHERRSLLEEERRSIQRRIQALRNALTTAPWISEFAGRHVLVRMAHQIALARDLNTQLKESYRVSLQIREALLEINWVLDGFISDLEEFDVYIADYIERSRQDHYKLLRKFLDPNFDAEAWLDREFIRQVGRIMPKLPTVEGELNKMLADFVDSAVQDYFMEPSSPEAKLWRNTVLSSLKQNWRAP